MIWIDSFHGQGYGGDLLVDLLIRLAGAADMWGINIVVIDVLDYEDPNKLAKRFSLLSFDDFEPLLYNVLCLIPSMLTVRMLTTQKTTWR